MDEALNKKLLISIVLVLAGLTAVVLHPPNLSSSEKNKIYFNLEKEFTNKDYSLEDLKQFETFIKNGIEADSAVVFDLNRKIFLYQKNPDKVRPLASLTKIMTAIVAKDKLVLNDFEKKEFEKMLLSSSNESASNLASVAGLKLSSILHKDYEKKFIEEMNKTAENLNLNNLHFENPTGLDMENKPGAVGTAREIAMLIEYSLDKDIPGFDSTRHSQLDIYGENATNTNTVVALLPNVIFSKTGFTNLAGGNLVTVIDPSLNRPVIIVLLGSTEKGRFTDMQKLANATLEFFSYKDRI